MLDTSGSVTRGRIVNSIIEMIDSTITVIAGVHKNIVDATVMAMESIDSTFVAIQAGEHRVIVHTYTNAAAMESIDSSITVTAGDHRVIVLATDMAMESIDSSFVGVIAGTHA